MLVADQRLLVGVAATLRWQAVDQEGAVADPGATTVRVVRADGTEVRPAGTATVGTGTSPRTVALTAAQNDRLDLLTATWTDAAGATHTTTHEVAGGFYCSVAEARAADPSLTPSYPDATLIEARRQVEDEFERICGRAFVPRYGRARVDLTPGGRLFLPDQFVRTIRAVTHHAGTVDTVATVDELAVLRVGAGIVDRIDGSWWPTGTVTVDYEHGYDRPPADVKRVAIMRLRQIANQFRSAIPDRAQQYTTGDGTIVFATIPGRDRTGVPEIDSVLAGYARSPVLA